MAAWVCTKTGAEEKGRVEGDGGRKENGNTTAKKTRRGDKTTALFTYRHRIEPSSAAFASSGQEKLNSQSKKKKNKLGGKWGFTGTTTFNPHGGAVI